MRTLLPLTGTLILIGILGAAGYLAMMTITPPQNGHIISQDAANPNSSNPLSVTPQLVPAPQPDTYFAAITDRPLFAPTRRANEAKPVAILEEPAPATTPVIVVQPEPEVEIPAPNLVLLGVLTGSARNSALISLNGSEPEWFRDGADIAGWKLTTIEADAIELSETDRSLRFELYRK
ncbi:hypothetical protein N9M66_06110 [Litoreibacter sp.]|nr:hypothetical protein [Litoreibacter sp.]